MRHVGSAMVVGGIAFAMAGTPAPLSAQDEAPAGERVEYVSTADLTELMHDGLAAIDGHDARVVRAEFPAGWVGEWHYHTGDVFVYVIDGELIIDLEGKDRVTVRSGEVYHEAINQVMQARNGSATRQTRALVFQVGREGEPLMIRAGR